ncbi:MAG TPA: response regulator transcription factor [Acidimicrobiales bacterium]|nr:response regulator transcription factor [Acidimicrobiales bacterium]
MGAEGGQGDRTRVLIVDDQRTLLDLLEIVVGQQPDLECVGAATTGKEAIELAAEHRPDVVLTDYRLPDIDGVEVTVRIKQDQPDVRVIMLTGHGDDARAMLRASMAGVSGFLPKESPIVEVMTAIRMAKSGGMLIHPAALAAVLAEARNEPGPTPQEEFGLTQREQEVLNLLGAGLDPQTIARALSLSVHTARGHVKSILSKLGAHSQLEAVVVAMRAGLVKDAAL